MKHRQHPALAQLRCVELPVQIDPGQGARCPTATSTEVSLAPSSLRQPTPTAVWLSTPRYVQLPLWAVPVQEANVRSP